jgi:hypothetical protein
MTAADPRDRLTAKEALQHPWITRLGDENIADEVAIGLSPPHSIGFISKNLALAPSDAPGEGACVIS